MQSQTWRGEWKTADTYFDYLTLIVGSLWQARHNKPWAFSIHNIRANFSGDFWITKTIQKVILWRIFPLNSNFLLALGSIGPFSIELFLPVRIVWLVEYQPVRELESKFNRTLTRNTRCPLKAVRDNKWWISNSPWTTRDFYLHHLLRLSMKVVFCHIRYLQKTFFMTSINKLKRLWRMGIEKTEELVPIRASSVRVFSSGQQVEHAPVAETELKSLNHILSWQTTAHSVLPPLTTNQSVSVLVVTSKQDLLKREKENQK